MGADGAVYVTGYFLEEANFGDTVLTAVGSFGMFVAQLVHAPVTTEGMPGSLDAPFHLSPLWPHPASTRTTAILTAPAGQPYVRAEVFDALGRRVAVAFEGALAAGVPTEVGVDASRLAPGVYVLRVTAGGSVAARRFVVVK